MFKNNKAKRGIAALLTLAMTASLCCTFVPSAEAKTSLPAVETIKANAVNGEPFNILEIVPESTQGSIGYYVNGYEPWLAMTGAQETPATRTSYVNNTLPGLLNRTVTSDTVGVGFSINLCAKGTGDNAAYPLNHVGGYKEAYPWGNTEGYTKQLTLATPESQSVRGNMTEVGVYQGDYINGNAVLNVNSGSMVQVITDLLPEAGAGNGYWYDVSFSSLSHDGESAADNTLVYEGVKVDLVDGGKYYQELVEGTDYDVVGDDGKPYIKSTTGYGETIDESGDFYLPVEFSIENNGKFYNEVEVSLTPEYSGTDGLYLRVVGVVGSATFPGLETGETYYAAVTGAPYTANSEAGKRLWASTESGFTSGNPGYFDTNGYDYVGAQNGNCALTLSAEGKTLTLSTDIVYYTGGFTNNNWFAKYVMDWDADDSALPDIRVNTVAARDLTESQIRDADLVVLGYGFDPAGSNYKDVFCADYKPDAQDTIDSALLAVTLPTLVGVGEKDGKYALLDTLQKKPVIVDYGLAYGSGSSVAASQNSDIKSAATAIVSAARTARGYSSADTNRTFAAESIYVMDAFGTISVPDQGTDEKSHIAGMPLVTKLVNAAEPSLSLSFSEKDLGSATQAEDPFYPVAEEIIYENFLRRIKYKNPNAETGADLYEIDFLATGVTQATTAKFIINFANSRKIANKTVVRVLDIEPRTGSMGELKSKLAIWLGITEGNIKVTTMSTSEFNAIQADICEEFDLIYVGDSVTGFNVANPGSDPEHPTSSKYSFDYITYNDPAMTYYNDSSKSSITRDSIETYLNKRDAAGWLLNKTNLGITFGMRYTAIGDKVQSGQGISLTSLGVILGVNGDYRLSGQLDRDYTFPYGSRNSWGFWTEYAAVGSVFNKSDTSRTFRYSGNDLTATAAKKLQEFAGLGYPVIFSDTLLQPPEFDKTTQKSATWTLSYKPFLVTYSAQIAATTPVLYFEGSTIKLNMEPVNNDYRQRWRIKTATVKLYKVGESKPIDTKLLQQDDYECSFNLSDYEIKSVFRPEDQFYCTYDITSYTTLTEAALRSLFGKFGDAIADIIDKIMQWIFTDDIVQGKTTTITLRGEAEPMFVDSSSDMYSTINSIIGEFNVMSVSSLNSEQINYRRTLLPKLVNLSKPTIDFLGDETDVSTLPEDVYPKEYAIGDDGTMTALRAKDGSCFLEYKFRIMNDSDPFPTSTDYTMKLYLDNNGNGKFEPEEVITDLSARELTVYPGGTSFVGDRVENGRLLGSYGTDTASSDSCHYYYVYYQLPAEVQGIVPWRLEVVDDYTLPISSTKRTGGHDSVSDFTRVAPAGEPETISILQINSLVDENLDLQENISKGNIFGELLNGVSTDFRVSMTTIPASFDDDWGAAPVSYNTSTTGAATTTIQNSFTRDGEKYTRQAEGEETATEFATLTELFMSYDMIIIGFSDAYRDLSLPVAEALAAYIKEKPVLMTHDVTSYCAINSENVATGATITYSSRNKTWSASYSRGSDVYGTLSDGVFGYYANMLLRDSIGMDRYGVSSLKGLSSGQTVGVSKYANISLFDNTNIQTAESNVFADETAAVAQAIANAVAIQTSDDNNDLQKYIRKVTGKPAWAGGFVPSTAYYNDGGAIGKGTARRTLLDEVEGQGYSIAWKANTAKDQTVAETQGVSSGTLFRFIVNSGNTIGDWFNKLISGAKVDSYYLKYASNDRYHLGETTAVTQVNRGQITTYPYDINTEAFSGGDSNGTSGYVDVAKNTQPVTLTHAQSYQLNLNYSADGSTSDMVVWYSLANDDSGVSVYQENDVVNNYYVYTVGNVTYTGSGHTTDDFDTRLAGAGADVVFEAKLFVNTMIAAYHAKLDTSKVSFTNKTGTTTDISDFFIVTDGNTILKTNSDGHVKDETRNIYFTASDNQAAAGETTNFRAEFYFGENFVEGLKLYDADTTEEVTNGALKNTYTYYIKLDELLAKIGDPSISDMATRGLNLKITPIYTGGGEPRDGTAVFAKLEFRQYKLFDLS